ncbi:hypothetical protein [Salicibibacter cibarius]|uniref:hypothetical protein n=1 Tax=Salicibibacter cibarius TaxID=2743000 RepID=UPI001B7D8BC8|nr:hypothetical protein [Salicibibacter cibarius]
MALTSMVIDTSVNAKKKEANTIIADVISATITVDARKKTTTSASKSAQSSSILIVTNCNPPLSPFNDPLADARGLFLWEKSTSQCPC